MEIEMLRQKAADLRRELTEVEAAIAVIERYATKSAMPPGRPLVKGSIRQQIETLLEERGPSTKKAILEALAGVPVATINAALSKNRDTFSTNGDGIWSLKKT